MSKVYLLLLFCIMLIKASSQVGSLDPTFGNNGIQTTTFLDTSNSLHERGKVVLTNANGDIFVVADDNSFHNTRIVRYLPNGKLNSSYSNAGYSNAADMGGGGAAFQGEKIIVAGYNGGYPSSDFVLARYTANGTLDSSFGEHGLVTTDFYNSDDEASSIVLQGDKIIVAGFTGHFQRDFALARYSTDGILDSSFGENGLVTTDFIGDDDFATAIVLQGDKIVVAGSSSAGSYGSNFTLARYTADGTLDTTFGEYGNVWTDFDNSFAFGTSMVLQGDKIIVAGYTGEYPNSDFALARYTANGTLDSSFGEHGLVTTDFYNSDDEASSIVLQGDKIIVAGYTGEYPNSDFALARYTANGTLDSSFGEHGKVTTDFYNSDDEASSIVLQGDKIVVAGSAYYPVESNSDFALARYTADGTLDSYFGENGKVTGHFFQNRFTITSTALQGDKILAAGSAYYTSAFALTRYTPDGTLDSSFGVNGLAATHFDNSFAFGTSMVLQGDKIIVAGYTGEYPNSDFALTRYTANGTLDSSFGEHGKVTTDFNNSIDGATSIALQGDKIIAAGYTQADFFSPSDFALARYTADGSLDSTFGVNGKVITDFNSPYDYATSMVLQGDKIVVAGYTGTYPYDYPHDFVLARYTADGTLDPSFGENGIVKPDFNNSDDKATSIALQGDKIIVAGYSDANFALARYTADGVLDSSFGVNGKVTTDFNNSDDRGYSMVLQGDKIIVAGYSDANFALARYTADGVLDSSFGVNGKVTTQLTGPSSISAIAVHGNRLYAVGNLTIFTNESYGVVAAYQVEAAEPSISIADVTVCESQKYAVLTVHLSAPSTQAVRVHYITHYNTAYPPQDYTGTSGFLQFAAGTTTAKIKIPIVNDTICEPTEQFEVRLSNPQNATLLDSVGIVTIKDDDKASMTAQANTALHSDVQENIQQSIALHITASPNPSANAFTIQLQGTNLKQQVSIRVYDISGRLLEARENINIGQILPLGDHYKAGTYIIEALQGSQRVQTKVIKTGK